MIANTAPAHVDLGSGDPVADVFAWDDDGHPMILTPSGLARADAVKQTAIVKAGWTHRSDQVVAFALCDHGCVHALTYGGGLLTTFCGYRMPGNNDGEGEADDAAPQSD